jgi:hypothetical protein
VADISGGKYNAVSLTVGEEIKGVRLDKSEGGVKDKNVLGSAEALLALPERLKDQGSGNLTLNHLRRNIVPPPIDSA